MTSESQKELSELTEQGLDLIKEHRIDEALEIADELLDRDNTFSGGYRVMAGYLFEKSRPGKAVEFLEKAMEMCPDKDRIHESLGNLYFRMDDEGAAEGHYQNAMDIAPDNPRIPYRWAHIAYERGDYRIALDKCSQSLKADPDYYPAIILRANTLIAQKKYNEALDTLVKCEAPCKNAYENKDDRTLSWLYSSMARAYYCLDNKERAQDLCWQALKIHASNNDAVQLIREIKNIQGKNTKHFRMQLQGVWHESTFGDNNEELGHPRFVTYYQVIADTPEEAADFIAEMEPGEVHESLEITECEEVEKKLDALKGVYRRSPYNFFLDQDLEE
jgi:tetratricopeptide (TPR) repeat protein